MREGIEFIRKVDEAWVPSAVFGSDTRNVGGADGGGTMCAMVGGAWSGGMGKGNLSGGLVFDKKIGKKSPIFQLVIPIFSNINF